jgi:hypothetical protein
VIALFLALAAPGGGIGVGDYVFVGFDSNDAVWMLRSEDFEKRTPSGFSGWVKVDHRRDKSTRARTSMMRVSISCQDRKFSILQNVSYSADGQVVSQYRDPYAPAHTDPAVPGSIGDMAVAEVCDKK